jgi:DNA-binding NtrC family response regulator
VSGAGTLLLVDDEPVVCTAVARVLGAAGFEVVIAPDGTAGLAHPDLDRCALVLCDLVLPDVSGAEVVRELHRRRPELPIIVITGYASTEAMSQAAEAGAVSFLAKPFDDAELLESVRRTLEAPAAGSAGKETS